MCVILAFFCSALCIAQNVELAPPENKPGTEFQGRIVLFDWFSHEFSTSEDIVVKTNDPHVPYARIVYRAVWGFDAPAGTANDRLDRWAFIGHGAIWSFTVHAPRDDGWEAVCRPLSEGYPYEDETGRGTVPRYVPTPGSDTSSVPPLKTLPCFLMERGGLRRLPSPYDKDPTAKR